MQTKISVVDSYTNKPVESNLPSRQAAETLSAQLNDGRRLDGREDRYYVRAPRVRVRTPTLAEVMRSYTHPNDNLWSQK